MRKALRDLGIAHVIAPTERFDSEALLALPELQNVAGWRVVILRGDGGRELLGDTLKAARCESRICHLLPAQQAQSGCRRIAGSHPDAITVTSSEALGYLWEMLEEPDRARLAAIPLFVPHARIAEAAKLQGWQKHVCYRMQEMTGCSPVW